MSFISGRALYFLYNIQIFTDLEQKQEHTKNILIPLLNIRLRLFGEGRKQETVEIFVYKRLPSGLVQTDNKFGSREEVADFIGAHYSNLIPFPFFYFFFLFSSH